MRIYRFQAFTKLGGVRILFQPPSKVSRGADLVLIRRIYNVPPDNDETLLHKLADREFTSPIFPQETLHEFYHGLMSLKWEKATDVTPELLHHPAIPEEDIIGAWNWDVTTVTPETLITLRNHFIKWSEANQKEQSSKATLKHIRIATAIIGALVGVIFSYVVFV